jgi:hypothetical protein
MKSCRKPPVELHAVYCEREVLAASAIKQSRAACEDERSFRTLQGTVFLSANY